MVFLTSFLCQRITYVKPNKTPDNYWKRRRILKMAAHFVGRKQRCYRLAVQHVRRALRSATLGRALKAKDLKELQLARLNAACEEHGFDYKYFHESLIRSNILLNKNVLTDLAIWEPRSFKCLTEFAWNKAKDEGLRGINDLGDPPSGVILRPMVRTLPISHIGKAVSGYTCLGLALAKCDVDKSLKETPKPEILTREACIKQACLMTVNSATTLLTTTSSALLDICREYKNSLNSILSLLEQVQMSEGENAELWDAVVEARAIVNKTKSALNELNLYMESVEKVVNSTTEAAFMAGSEYMCSSLCERMYSAQKEINHQLAELKKMEEEYVRLQQEIARDKSKHLSSKKTSNNPVSEKKQVLGQ